MSHRALIASVTTGLVVAAAAVLVAGPLTPPAGPVTGSYKTLTDVEPRMAINATNTPGDADSLFAISAPGSYYLTGNITGTTGKHGIKITSPGVTLDLNGFFLQGLPFMGPFDGVHASGNSQSDITVRNGTVRGWGSRGVNLIAVPYGNTRVQSVSVIYNGQAGIETGNGSIIENCSASTGNGGILTGERSVVHNCRSDDNFFFGILTGAGSAVSNCSVSGGFGGLIVGPKCIVTDCTVSDVSTGTAGISAGDGCAVSGCAVNNNTGRGISANNGCQITGCVTRNNALDGISVNFSCTVTGNTCNGDGTAAGNQGGIRVLGQANRIEGNNVTYADHGLLVESGGNVIVRNTVKACTLNWSIVANNVCGPILDRTAPANAAVNGNSAPSSLGSTDANANYTY